MFWNFKILNRIRSKWGCDTKNEWCNRELRILPRPYYVRAGYGRMTFRKKKESPVGQIVPSDGRYYWRLRRVSVSFLISNSQIWKIKLPGIHTKNIWIITFEKTTRYTNNKINSNYTWNLFWRKVLAVHDETAQWEIERFCAEVPLPFSSKGWDREPLSSRVVVYMQSFWIYSTFICMRFDCPICVWISSY